MVDPVLGEKRRKKQSTDISRENRWKNLRAGRKERILARKNNNSGTLENNITDENEINRASKLTEEIAMSLITKKVDVPSISTSSELSICHIDNESISIAGWIGFKRIMWGRLPPRSPCSTSSQSSSIRSRSRSRSSLARSSSCATPQLVIRSAYGRVAKTDDAIVVLKESLVWKSISDECFESGI